MLRPARHREKTQEHVVGSLDLAAAHHLFPDRHRLDLICRPHPLTSTAPAAAEFTTPLRPLSDVIRMVGWVLPTAALRRTNAWCQGATLVFAVCRAGRTAVTGRAPASCGRITDQMRSRAAGQSCESRPEPERIQSARRRWRSADQVVSAGLAVDRALSAAGLGSGTQLGRRRPAFAADLHRPHQRIPYFQSLASSPSCSRCGLPEHAIRAVQADFGHPQAIHHQHQTQIRASLLSRSPSPGRRALLSPATTSSIFVTCLWPLSPTRGEARSQLDGLRSGRHEAVQAGFRRQASRSTLQVQGVARGEPWLPNLDTARLSHRRRRRHARAARELLPVHPRAGWRMVVSLWRAHPPGGMRAARAFLPNSSLAGPSRRALGTICFAGGSLIHSGERLPIGPSTRYHSLRRDRQRGELH